MRSRVALVAVLALGIFMSGTGATLAVSGFANTGSASSAQYPTTNEHHKKGHHVVEAATDKGTGCTEGSNGANSSSGECAEPAVTTEPAAAVVTEPVQQVAATDSSSSLPFTGFVALPVLLVGLGLLGAGVAMRLRGRREDHTI